MNPVLVALDVATAPQAADLVDTLVGVVGGFKIGKQLFTAEGPNMVRQLSERKQRVFLDLKFHDIPNTVAGAVASAVSTGAWMINVHASGGRMMMEAAVEAAATAALRTGRERPILIGVTVLTSFDSTQLREIGVSSPVLDHVVYLAKLAKEAGLDGVVASPHEIAAIRQTCGRDFVIVTPGIRPHPASTPQDDQARTMSPAEAMAAGATYLVIGRPITGAPDPRLAAQEITQQLSLL